MKLVLVNGIIKGEGCTVGLLPEVKKEILSLDSLRSLSFPLTVQHSYEVALLRVFCYQNTWRVATARKLDAFKSFWAASFSFGESLTYALGQVSLDAFFAALDPNIAYFILIPLRDNQRLGTFIPAPENSLWLAATQNLETGEFDIDPAAAPAPCALLPKVTVQSAEELLEYYAQNENPHLTGFMLTTPETMTRFVTEEYMYYFKLRGNEPNIYKKYLELLKGNNDEDVNWFYEQHRAALHDFDMQMKELVNFIHDKYVERYVHKQYTLFPRPVHAILKQCHALYLSDRTERITRNRAAEVILSFPALFILNALEQYKQPHSGGADYAPPAKKPRPRRRAALESSPNQNSQEAGRDSYTRAPPPLAPATVAVVE